VTVRSTAARGMVGATGRAHSATRGGDFVGRWYDQLVSFTARLRAVRCDEERCGLILPICGCLVAMLTPAVPAHSEGAARENVPNQVAPGQGLTIADLEGAKIRVKLITQMLAQREGGPQGPVTTEADWNIVVDPGAKVSWTYQPTSHTRRGTQVGQKIASTATLDEPWHTQNGEAIWQFNDGNLIFVRSYKGGAVRTIIAFKQDGPSLTCSAGSAFARERGKNGLIMNSPIDGAPVTIFSWKPASSSCEVTR
jgi:hypothetical protein